MMKKTQIVCFVLRMAVVTLLVLGLSGVGAYGTAGVNAGMLLTPACLLLAGGAYRAESRLAVGCRRARRVLRVVKGGRQPMRAA